MFPIAEGMLFNLLLLKLIDLRYVNFSSIFVLILDCPREERSNTEDLPCTTFVVEQLERPYSWVVSLLRPTSSTKKIFEGKKEGSRGSFVLKTAANSFKDRIGKGQYLLKVSVAIEEPRRFLSYMRCEVISGHGYVQDFIHIGPELLFHLQVYKAYVVVQTSQKCIRS